MAKDVGYSTSHMGGKKAMGGLQKGPVDGSKTKGLNAPGSWMKLAKMKSKMTYGLK